MNIGVFIHDHQNLVQHHLAQAPEGEHDLPGVHGILLVDGNNGHIMENTFHGKFHVHHFREHLLENGQEQPFGGLAQPAIFHGRLSNNGRWIDGILTVGDTSHVEYRVLVGQTVIACMVAKGSFQTPFPGLNITFQNEIGVGIDHQVDSLALHQFHGLLAQEPSE